MNISWIFFVCVQMCICCSRMGVGNFKHKKCAILIFLCFLFCFLFLGTESKSWWHSEREHMYNIIQ